MLVGHQGKLRSQQLSTRLGRKIELHGLELVRNLGVSSPVESLG